MTHDTCLVKNAGNSGIWFDDNIDIMVCKIKRTILCLYIQSADACGGGHSDYFLTGRETTYWLVPILWVVVIFVYICALFNSLMMIYDSVIGTVLIVCGLYVVLWGKSKEMEMEIEEVESKSKESQSTVDDRI